MFYKSNKAFTLIELLTVIAIIGILAAILIPTVGAAKTAANKAKTRVQFSQWASSMELFKQEYGYYPVVTSSNLMKPDVFTTTLTGKKSDGTAASTSELNGNTKKLSFYSIADSELLKDASGTPLSPNVIIDAFANSDIAMLVDANGDGFVSGGELAKPTVRPGNSVDGFGTALTPDSTYPAANPGVRAGVLFYSAGKGATASDIVYSWK